MTNFISLNRRFLWGMTVFSVFVFFVRKIVITVIVLKLKKKHYFAPIDKVVSELGILHQGN